MKMDAENVTQNAVIVQLKINVYYAQMEKSYMKETVFQIAQEDIS